jgi:drug/metabolite transporter (DMT)-like permease
LAYVVLGETLGPFQLIGSAIVLGGVLLVSQGKQTPASLANHNPVIKETKKND